MEYDTKLHHKSAELKIGNGLYSKITFTNRIVEARGLHHRVQNQFYKLVHRVVNYRGVNNNRGTVSDTAAAAARHAASTVMKLPLLLWAQLLNLEYCSRNDTYAAFVVCTQEYKYGAKTTYCMAFVTLLADFNLPNVHVHFNAC